MLQELIEVQATEVIAAAVIAERHACRGARWCPPRVLATQPSTSN